VTSPKLTNNGQNAAGSWRVFGAIKNRCVAAKLPSKKLPKALEGENQRKDRRKNLVKGRQPETLAAISLPYQLVVRTQEPPTLLTSQFPFWVNHGRTPYEMGSSEGSISTGNLLVEASERI
jgi:hypothetical protein